MKTAEFFDFKYSLGRYPNKPRKIVTSFIRKHIKKGMVVLDYGCGNGRHLKYMIDRGIHCMGTDVSTIAVRNANHLIGKNVAFTCPIFTIFL